jgi:hypothetical protein
MRQAKATRCHIAQAPRQGDVALGERVHHPPRIAPQHHLGHGLGREVIGPQRIETEQIAGHQEFADLAPAVLHQVHHPDAAAHDAVAPIRPIALAVNFAVMLNRHGRAELFQKIERVSRDRDPVRDGRASAVKVAEALLRPLHRRLHLPLHHPLFVRWLRM